MFGNFMANPSQGASYEDLQRQQVLAAALANRALTPNQTAGGGIAQIAQAFASRRMGKQSSQAMQEARNKAGEQLRMAGESAGLDPQLMQMANNPYMSAGQKQVLGALIKQKMGNTTKPTSAIQHYELAKSQGFEGTFMDYQTQLAGASVPKQYGTIPSGHRLVEGNDGTYMEPIPGSPAALEAEAALKKAQLAETNTNRTGNVVLEDIGEIRKDLNDPNAGTITGPIGKIRSWFPGNVANDVANRLGTIKANIGFEKLNSMRQASPTGGALGNVTERELGFLQQVFGSLEQSQTKEEFERNLERVERIFHETVHGPGSYQAPSQDTTESKPKLNWSVVE